MRNIPTTVKNRGLVKKRRRQIVLAAIRLFSKKGFHKTTLRELADEAGLSYGNIYDYIGSKEDIFSLIHDYSADLVIKALHDSIANVADPIEKLRRIIRSEFKLMDQMTDAIMLIYQESHILSKPFLHKLLQKERKHLELIEESIQESINIGQLRNCNIRLTANLIKSMIDAWVIKRWDLRGHSNRIEAEQSIISLIFNGLLAEPRSEESFNYNKQPSYYQNYNNLQDHSVLIVNSATPIASAICNSLQSCGAKLGVQSEPHIKSRENPVTCEFGPNVSFYSTSDYGDMNIELYHKIEKDFGQIDVFIQDLSSGILDFDSSNGIDPGGRLDANLHLAQEMAAMFQCKTNSKTPHRMIFIAPWSWDSYLDEIHFESAKASVIALTRTLAKRMSIRSVNVNCIVPGFIKTIRPSNLEKQFGNAISKKIPIGFMGEINDVVEATFFLTCDAAKYITGQVVYVSGGLL